MFEIAIYWEEMEASGQTCKKCKEIITGTVYVLMLQVGGPMDAKPSGYFCKVCEFSGDNSGTETDENE